MATYFYAQFLNMAFNNWKFWMLRALSFLPLQGAVVPSAKEPLGNGQLFLSDKYLISRHNLCKLDDDHFKWGLAKWEKL